MTSPAFVQCRRNGLFWNMFLARAAFGTRMFTAFPHVPHLWERRIMYAVEAALGEHLLACRRNKLRDPRVDVNVHVQYEGWREARRHNPGDLAFRILSGPQAAVLRRMAPRASLCLFNILTRSRNVKFYGDISATMDNPRTRPTFVTIDDHLVAADEALLAFHRERIGAFYETNWPASIGAPWEVATAVPHPVIDPARFVATPPPAPTPSPSYTPSRTPRTGRAMW